MLLPVCLTIDAVQERQERGLERERDRKTERQRVVGGDREQKQVRERGRR